MPIVVGSAFFFGRRLRRASTGVQDRVAEAMGTADEAFSQIRTVQSFVREDEETRRYGALLGERGGRAPWRARSMRALLFGVVGFVAFAGVVAVLWQGGQLVLEGALTPGALVSFLLYAITVAAAVGSLASLFGSYQEAVGAAQRVFELLQTAADRRRARVRPAPLHTSRARGGVAASTCASATRPSCHEVLERRDVRHRAGRGGGARRAVGRRQDDDRVAHSALLGRDGGAHHARRRRHSRSLVRRPARRDRPRAAGAGAVQRHGAREHRLRAPRRERDDEVLAAARAAHALEFIERLPDGLDTLVGERGVKLSGGQRQRIAIARVFLKDPAVVVLDEATTSLDNESERLVEEAMEELLRGRTTLIIAHRLRTVRRADRVLVLEHGRIVEKGTHEELSVGGRAVRAALSGGAAGLRRPAVHRSCGSRSAACFGRASHDARRRPKNRWSG